MKPEILGILPARGGSKSIPKKNIARLGGKPLIAYVIDAMKASQHITRVIVSTDDAEIAAVARDCGAEVPFMRPAEFAQDSSPTMPVLFHAVEWLAKNEGYRPDMLVLSQPTSPFTRAQQMDQAIEMLKNDAGASAVTTVIEVEHNYHPYNIRQINADASVTFMLSAEHDQFPTRQSKPIFYAFGNAYIFRYATLTQQRSIYGKRCLPLIIDRFSAFDINDPHELVMAEAMLAAGAIKLR